MAGPGGHLFVTGKTEYLGQILASLAVSFGPLTAGLSKGYSSPAIASLQQREGDAFPVSGQQASWLASLSLLGALFGAPLGGAAVRWGRRRTLLLAGGPLSICWIITVFAVSVEVMCLAAFLSGFLVAIVQLAAQVYVSEIAASSVRGGLSALLKIAGNIGVLVAFTAGAFLDWRQLAGLIALAPAAMCLAMWWVPESPGWLVLRGKDREAAEALRWLRGDTADLHLELAVLQAHVLTRTVPSNPKLLLETLRTPALIACGLMFFQRFSGVNAFHFYVVSVFKETFFGFNPHSAAVSIAIVELLSSLLSGLLVDLTGRLPLLVTSSVMMSMALASFGSFAYYIEANNPRTLTNLDYIPLLCAMIFTVAFSLGISPISWLLVSELFSLEHRGMGTALATGFSYLCAFVGVKTFIDFKELLGLYGAFWLYAAISLSGLCFIVLCVPETKGRDLIEIDAAR